MIHATVLRMGEFLMELEISSTAPSSPPGVSSSMMSASAPAATASAMRRFMLRAVMASIGPLMVRT